MLIAVSAVSEDPKSFNWFKFNGKRPAMIAPNLERKLEPDELFGVRPIAKRKDFYLVFPDKLSKKIRIDPARHLAIVSKSKAAKFVKPTASSRKGVGGRKAREIMFDHPRWQPKTQPSAASEKSKGIDCKDYQWRTYKQTRPLKVRVNKNRDPIELHRNDVFGMRFIKPATGGILLYPDGTRRAVPTAVYDEIVEATALMPKNRWLTKIIEPEMVKAANISNRAKALNEQRQIKQEMREAKAAREREAAAKRKKEKERREEEQRQLDEMLSRKGGEEERRKKQRERELNESKVGVGDYIRDVILGGRLDEEILDVLDMDDLESIEIDLDDMADLDVSVKKTDKEFAFDDDPSDDILSGLDSILESARQEDEEEIQSELESEEADAEDDEEEPEETEEPEEGEEEEPEEDSESDAEESDEDEELSEDEDFSEMEEDSEEPEDGEEEDAEPEEDEEELPEDEDFSDFEDDEEESDEEPEEEPDEELDSIMSELDDADSENEEAEEEEGGDDEDFDDEEPEEDDLETLEDEELEDEEFDDEDATLDDDDEDFEDDEEDDVVAKEESEGEEEDDSQEDPDDVIDSDADPEDDDVAAAEKELDSMGEFDDGANIDDEEEEEPTLPEEADILTFNDDEDNRKFLVLDVADMRSNDKVKMLKLYDMDNEPDEVHVVRVHTERLKQFTDNIEVVSRMNAKTFGSYVMMVEEYPKSKEKLV